MTYNVFIGTLNLLNQPCLCSLTPFNVFIAVCWATVKASGL